MSQTGTFTATFTVTQKDQVLPLPYPRARDMASVMADSLEQQWDGCTVTVDGATFTPSKPRYHVERLYHRSRVFDTREAEAITVALTLEQAGAVAKALNDLEAS